MIPKLIHYCWFGPPIDSNAMAYSCKKSWQKLGGGYTNRME